MQQSIGLSVWYKKMETVMGQGSATSLEHECHYSLPILKVLMEAKARFKPRTS